MSLCVLARYPLRLRKFFFETLESRQLMAADMLHHNFMMPEDSDRSGDVTPLDALVVINRLNGQGISDPTDATAAVDIDADGSLSPLDALTVINYVNRSIGASENLASQVNVQNRIDRLEEAIGSELLPPNVDLAMATQLLEILRAGGFPEIGDRIINGLLAHSSGVTSSDPGSDGNETPDADEDETEEMDEFVETDFDGNVFLDTNDPTDDNGNGFFLDAEAAAPIADFVVSELRKQLKVGNDAAIRAAVFTEGGEFMSGTWRYLTEEGVSISGNWQYVTGNPETLNLFRSNVDIEKRIYVQYPGSGFIYYSWLPGEEVGYYFSPIGNPADFDGYFRTLPGSNKSTIAGFTSFSGDLGVFDGIAPIEQQASRLYAIDRTT